MDDLRRFWGGWLDGGINAVVADWRDDVVRETCQSNALSLYAITGFGRAPCSIKAKVSGHLGDARGIQKIDSAAHQVGLLRRADLVMLRGLATVAEEKVGATSCGLPHNIPQHQH